MSCEKIIVKNNVAKTCNDNKKSSGKHDSPNRIKLQIELGLCLYETLYPSQECQEEEEKDGSTRHQQLFDSNVELLQMILQTNNEYLHTLQSSINENQVIGVPSLLQHLVSQNALISFIDLLDKNLRTLHQYSPVKNISRESSCDISTTDHFTYIPGSLVHQIEDFLFSNPTQTNCLLSFYNGSCSNVDTKILSLLFKYQRLAKVNIVPCLLHFGMELSSINGRIDKKSFQNSHLGNPSKASDKINLNII